MFKVPYYRIPELTLAPVVTSKNGKARHHQYTSIYIMCYFREAVQNVQPCAAPVLPGWAGELLHWLATGLFQSAILPSGNLT